MSGSNSYTEEEVLARSEALQAGAAVLDRNKNQSAVDLVSGVQDLVFRSLNSDVDAIYALLKLFANRHIIICSKILSNIDLLIRYAPVSRQTDPKPDTTKLDRLIAISDELEVADEGRKQLLLQEFSRVTEALVSSSVGEDGFHNAGISPSYAKEQSLALAEETNFLIGVLLEEIPRFHGALDEYTAAELEPLSLENQAKLATKTLQSHVGSSDLSAAILDSVVLNSLLSRRSSKKRDVTIPKYEGSVTTLPGTRAEMVGDTKPFIIEGGAASDTFEVDEQSSATISGPESGAPENGFLVNSTLFESTDAGALYTQYTKQILATERWFSTTGYAEDPYLQNSGLIGGTVDDLGYPIVTIPRLKTTTRPSDGRPGYENGVNVNFWYFDSGQGPVEVNCVDNGYGILIDKSTTTEAPHELDPDTPFDGNLEQFTVPGFGDPPTTNQLRAQLASNSTLSITLTEQMGAALIDWQTTTNPDPNNPGYNLCVVTSNTTGASAPSLSVNYNTGKILLDTDGYAPAATDYLQAGAYMYHKSYGYVHYLTGHMFIRMPYPAVEGTSIHTNYKYLPVATVSTGDSGIQTGFTAIRAHLNNDLVGAPIPVITETPSELSPGIPASWITTPQMLVNALNSSALTDKFLITSEAQGASTNILFRPHVERGSAARLAFPNYLESTLLLAAPFAPTWSTPLPNTNYVLGATYASRKERFGKDTQFSQVSSIGLVDVDCPENTLMTGVSFTVDSSGETLTFSEDIQAEEGDDLRVRWSAGGAPLSRGTPVFHTKVLAYAALSGGSYAVEVYPPLTLAVDDTQSEQLTNQGDWTCDISRSRIRARSQSSESDSTLAVTSTVNGGLGFDTSGDLYSGFSTEVQLEVDLQGTYPRDGYEIHPNDVVLEELSGSTGTTLRPLGRVIAVSGNKLTMRILDGVSPVSYPYENLKIVAYGWFKFITMVRDLRKAEGELISAAGSGELQREARVFVSSGSGQGQYVTLLEKLSDAMNSVREAYLLYDAHIVKTVDELLGTLKQERLTLPMSMLTTARFGDLANLTVEEVSEQSNIDNLLLAAFDKLGGETDFFEVSFGAGIMDDYYNRGQDDKVDELINPLQGEEL